MRIVLLDESVESIYPSAVLLRHPRCPERHCNHPSVSQFLCHQSKPAFSKHKNSHFGNIVQWMKVPATKRDTLGLLSGHCMVLGKN